MAPPPSHGEHIARMKVKGQKPTKTDEQWFAIINSWTSKFSNYEQFLSWLQGYAYKWFCRHRKIYLKYCPGCDKVICHRCLTTFARQYTATRAPSLGEVYPIPCNHRK